MCQCGLYQARLISREAAMAQLGEGSSAKSGLSLGFWIHFSSWIPMLCTLTQQLSPKCVMCPVPTMAAAPVQLCHLCSASCVVLADNSSLTASRQTSSPADVHFTKLLWKQKRQKTCSYFIAIKWRWRGEWNEDSAMDSSGSWLQDQVVIFPLAGMLSLNAVLCSKQAKSARPSMC